jgi:hypothetical protein
MVFMVYVDIVKLDNGKKKIDGGETKYYVRKVNGLRILLTYRLVLI